MRKAEGGREGGNEEGGREGGMEGWRGRVWIQKLQITSSPLLAQALQALPAR